MPGVSDRPAWLPAVTAAHSAGVTEQIEDGVTVRRISGGANNALYRVDVDGRSFACKLCVNDDRRRAAQEYHALMVLNEARLDLAPRPVWLDESCVTLPFPAVVYEWLPGRFLTPSLASRQLPALLDSLERVHGLRPGDFPSSNLRDSWFHWYDFGRYLDELRTFLADYGPWLRGSDPDGPALLDRLERLVAACGEVVARSRADPSRDRVVPGLCRVDANLANAIQCDDGRLRWVDWEYSGWGDPALDFADFRWHVALDELTDEQHRWLRDHYRRPAGDANFDARLRVWDCILATRWSMLILRALWSRRNGPDRVRLTQPAGGDEGALRARLIRFIERAERVTRAK